MKGVLFLTMELVELERKSRILTKAQFGCLQDVYTLNVTKGCEFMCVYCYARGYPSAPSPGEVHLYRNLPTKLAKELDNPRRSSVIKWVAFNTASDSFQTHPMILDVAFHTMKILLERGVGFSFLTKGWIPDRFIKLFSNYPGLVSAKIGLVSTSTQYQDLFEPYAAHPARRLQNIDRLREIGIQVEVRIDPIIPFYTDDETSIKRLYEALAKRGVKTVSLSYLHLRPAILQLLKQGLPPTPFKVLRSCFETQPWTVVGASTRSKLIPLLLRKRGYSRFIRIARSFGFTPLICSCKNPDMGTHLCYRDVSATKPSREDVIQLSLFPSCL